MHKNTSLSTLAVITIPYYYAENVYFRLRQSSKKLARAYYAIPNNLR